MEVLADVMVTGNHFAILKCIKSTCYALQTYTMSYVNYITVNAWKEMRGLTGSPLRTNTRVL